MLELKEINSMTEFIPYQFVIFCRVTTKQLKLKRIQSFRIYD